MTTKLSKKPRIPLPEDIQPGDVLVLRNGKRRVFMHRAAGGDAICRGNMPIGFRPDGRWWQTDMDSLLQHRWDVVAIQRKAKPKKERPDKDAAWLMAAMIPRAGSGARQARIRAIAKRLNGGAAL